MVDKSEKKFILVDGSSYLYRAFYALPHLKNTKGEHTGAIYGVSNMISKLLREYDPAYLCVVFDARGKNFRHKISSDYKANRSPMPEELSQQVEPILNFIKSLGINVLQVKGVEADDVIATLSIINSKKYEKIIISSGDKDLAQLVNKKVTLINSMDGKILDVNGVIKKFGVPPEKIFEYLVLIGDKSDNIAGVDKIGPKTAINLLDKYDNLEGILKNIENISGKVGENLKNSHQIIETAKKLISLKKDVDIDLNIDSYIIVKRNNKVLSEIVNRYELKNISESYSIKKLEKRVNKNTQYHILKSKNEFDKLFKKLKLNGTFAFDTETTSIDAFTAKLVGLSFSMDEFEAYYIPILHFDGDNIDFDHEYLFDVLNQLFSDKTITVIGQNLKYDINVLSNYNVSFDCNIEDTMLLSYIHNSSRKHDLNNLANKYLDHDTIKYEDIVGTGVKQKSFQDIEVSKAFTYACEDADITLRLYNFLIKKISGEKELYELYKKIEIPLVEVISSMEQRGVMIDKVSLIKQSKNLDQRIKAIETNVYRLADKEFNISSPKQIQEIFYNDLNLPILKKTPKGQPSTNEDVMQELSTMHDLPKYILQYRNLMKLKTTYTDKLGEQVNPMTNRLHTSYNQTVTITGRLSSSNPNLQNIPIKTQDGKNIRKTFIATKGYKILSADYSQIELRVMAHLSKDKTLINSFLNNEDVHASTAKEVFSLKSKPSDEQRRSAKTINFGLIYGISSYGLSKQLKIDNKAAKEYIEKYFQKYRYIKEFMEKTKKEAKKIGYVSTLSGRRIYMPNITHSNFQIRSAAERTAINAPIQGTAADILKMAMIDINRWIKQQEPPIKMIMQVHDELVFEVQSDFIDEAKTQISNLMSSCFIIDVPLIVDIGVGDNWDKAH